VLERAKREIVGAKLREDSVAFLLVDLDRYAEINDTYGPAVGDAALKMVGQRLEQAVRGRSDVVGRYGGDEFLVLLPQVKQRDGAALVAGRILQALGAPMVFQGNYCEVHASIGIAIYPQDGLDLASLLSHANAALFFAKGTGRNRYAFAEASDEMILAIEPTTWRPEFDLGVPEIDLQHHRLNDAMNELGRDLRSGVELRRLQESLYALIELLEVHFETEERYMDQHPQAQDTEHKGEHARLLRDLPLLLTGFGRSNLALAVRHVYDWLNRHVETYDRHLYKARGAEGVPALGRDACACLGQE